MCLAGGGLLGSTRGDLYTWGGEFTWVDQKKDKAGHVTTKRDSHKGCLGLGDADGRLTPTRYAQSSCTTLCTNLHNLLHNYCTTFCILQPRKTLHNPAQLRVCFSLAQPCTTSCTTSCTTLYIHQPCCRSGYDLMKLFNVPMNEATALMRSETKFTCRVFGPWRTGAAQQAETGELQVLQCANE